MKSKAAKYKRLGKATFFAGVTISTYQGIESALDGDYIGVAKSGLDIAMGAIAAYGGPVGLAIGGTYFALDVCGAFEKSTMIPPPYVEPHFSIQDNTYIYVPQ